MKTPNNLYTLILPIIILLAFSSCKVQDRRTISITPGYQANKVYTTNFISRDSSTTEYLDNTEIVDQLRAQGVEYPITALSEKVIETTMHTGQEEGEGYGFSIQYNKVNSSLSGSIISLTNQGNEIEQLEGVQIRGWIKEDGQIEIDTFENLGNDALKPLMEQTLKTALEQKIIAQENIRVGESFQQQIPLQFPIGNGKVIDMIIDSDYSLDGLSRDIAFLSFTQEMKMNSQDSESEFSISGQGEGVIHYDTKNKIFLLYQTQMDLQNLINSQGFKLLTKSTNYSIVKTKIN